MSRQPMFKFELGWLLRDGFMEMVKDIWANATGGQTPMERWQCKIRRLRQHQEGGPKIQVDIIKRGKRKF
jgi:hypothetical protein